MRMHHSLAIILAIAAPIAAKAGPISVSYLGAGVESQSNTPSATYHVENFDGPFNGTTTFGGSGNTGTYTALTANGYQINSADQYGGAGNTGNYIVSLNQTGTNASTAYSLTLSSPINYFGFWLSAQDAGNEVQIYNGANLLYTYTPSVTDAAIGTCQGGAYCGNPSDGLANASQNYAFVQFYDPYGTFNKLVFTELNTGNGYESDNHTIANLTSAPNGTVVLAATPEPSSLLMLGTGLLAIGFMMRRRLAL